MPRPSTASHARTRTFADVEWASSLSPDAIVIAGSDGRIASANALLESLFGYPRDELIGAPLEVLIPERLRAIHRTHVATYMAQPRARPMGSIATHLVGRRRDGSEFPVDISLNPVSLADEFFVIAAVRDRSERARLESGLRESEERQRLLNEELEAKLRALNAANEELEAFTYTASHDLRGPLRGIDGLAQALLEDHAEQLDPDGRATLEMMRRSTRRMSELVSDLLEFSRAARSEIHIETIDLSALAKDVGAELALREPHRRIDFVVAPAVAVRADRSLVRIVLENLLGNAWKYTARTPVARIEFGASPGPGGQTTCFVKDNGAGFDMGKASRLFRPFHRLHAPADFEGTGIGLATVRRIVERHGGTVGAEGAPGGGARVWFTLPEPTDAIPS